MAEAPPRNIINGAHGAKSRRNPDQPRGYPHFIIIDAESIASYQCGFCGYILRLPCQVECGHQFCEECLRHVSRPVECPPCAAESENTIITPENYQPDFACRKRMKNLGIYCENKDAGCTWQGRFIQLDGHLVECDYIRLSCVQCHELVTRRHLADHQENECMGAPLDTSGPCMFGCQGLPRDVDIDKHNQDSCAEHVAVILREVDRLNRTKNRIDKLAGRISSLSNAREAENQNGRVDPVDTGINELMENINKMEISTKTSTNLINVAFKEVQRVAARIVDLERMFQEQFIRSSSGELSERQQEISRLSEQLSHQNMSQDGVLLWEISGIRQKIEEATRDGIPIDSPVFSTSQSGYHLMGRLYLNGDGSGKDRFISFFIVVCKGPYDGTLTWPFKQLVHFTLFDQSGNREHHKYTFCTDPSSSSFARPRQAANIASGCPQFISLHEFNRRYDQFVEEDTMMLEIRIDQGMPTA